MAKTGTYQPIEVLAGVEPSTDSTAFKTQHYTSSNFVRFKNLMPEKLAGWASTLFDFGATVAGTVRTLFTEVINGKFYIVLGSNEKLYSVIGSTLTNITPLQTMSVAAANSLATHFDALSNNPFASVNGSAVITVTDADFARLREGDVVTFSGATGFAGIMAGDINGPTLVRSVGVGSYTVNFGVVANATTSGGGAAVNRSSGIITLTSAAHGNLDGYRVKIEGAATTGGILNTEINQEFIIRNVTVNTFDFVTTGTATSSVSGGGGAGTEYYEEIAPGQLDQTNASGYGAGLYGIGLYGTALVSSTAITFPRVWFCDRYADTIVMTPGNQGGLYQWQGDNDTAPELVSGAPTAINYAFVSDSIVITFGAGGIENRIFASDQNDITEWTSSSVNQVFDDDIEGAGRWVSHVPVEDYNLIFTETQTYTFRYIGLPFVWETKEISNSVGIIAPMARCDANGTPFWMGYDNFYMFRGGNIEVVPANSQRESTCLKYVFDNINWGQKSKIFAWYNNKESEVWFHYPTADSNEPNRVVVVNVQDFTWTTHDLPRTAGESAGVRGRNPWLINIGTLYQHEVGTDDDGQPMSWSLTSNRRYYGTDTANVNSIIPDSIQTGNVTFTDTSYLFPQSVTPMTTVANQITPTTEKVEQVSNGRFREYTWAGSELGQRWKMGTWMEELQKGPRN